MEETTAKVNNEIMITAEEFFRNKIKEQNPNREVVTLSQELITAEQGMRWANEFKQLHLHSVVGQSEQLVCDCGNKLTDKEMYFGQCLQCDKNIEE